MDHSLAELQRRFHADPSDRQALHAFARGLAATDKTVDAYNLLFDYGAVEREEPLALEIGARLSKLEEALHTKKLGRDSEFACKSNEDRNWDYHDFATVQEMKLPVLAIRLHFVKNVSKTLLKSLGGFPALRLFLINSADRFTNKSLLSIPQIPTLRHLVLNRANRNLKSEVIQRETFRHLCTLGPLKTLQVKHCRIALEDYELCALQPNLKALHLGFEKSNGRHLEFLSQFTQLENLELHCPQYIEKTLPPLPKSIESLEVYEMLYGADCVQSLNLPNLKHLSLKNSNLSDKDLEWIAELDGIQTLELDGNPGLSDEGITQLAKLAHLEKLSLRHCIGLTENVLGSLAKLTKLKVLMLPLNIDAAFAEEKLKGSPGLNIVDLTHFADPWWLKTSLSVQCEGFIS